MAMYEEILKALRALDKQKGVVTQQQGVMTDPGPENARAYSAILAGRDPDSVARSEGQAGRGYTNILPSPPPAAPQPLTPGTSSGAVMADAPGSAYEPMFAGAHYAPDLGEGSVFVPDYLKNLSDADLRSVINQMHGVQSGRKGSVGNRTKRQKLLELASKALGHDRVKQQGKKLLEGLATQSETASSSTASLPGYESILSGMSQMPSGESAIAGMGAANLPDVNVPGYQSPTSGSVAPLGSSLTSQTTAAGGNVRGLGQSQSNVMTPALAISRTQMRNQAAMPGGTGSGVFSSIAAGSGPQQAYGSILAGQQAPPVSSFGTVMSGSGGPAGGLSGQQVQLPEAEILSDSLRDAFNRLTDAVSSAAEKQKTVSQETAGMSWGERLKRLEQNGTLMNEQAVKDATLKGSVTPHDIITESERREQHARDRRRAGQKEEIALAGEGLAKSFGGSVSGIASKLFGPRIGTAIGGGAQSLVGAAIPRVLGMAAGGTAGAAGAGGGGMLAAGGAAMANPAGAAIAVTAAFYALPGVVNKFATSLVEGQRHLAQYNAQLTGLYARLDYQKRILDAQQAHATGATGGMLGGALGDLRKETQWMREGLGNALNLAGTVAVDIARGINVLMRFGSILGPLASAIQAVIDWLPGSGSENSVEIIRSMQEMEKWARPQGPKNQKPAHAENQRKDRK